MRLFYFVNVKKDADLSKASMIYSWNRVSVGDHEPDPIPDPGDGLRAVRLPDMDDAHWPPLLGDFQNKALKDGTIVDYVQPPYVAPLKVQAQNAMQHVQQQAPVVLAMGETFGPKMRDYVKALRAIIDGSDTTSTALPNAPSDPTM